MCELEYDKVLNQIKKCFHNNNCKECSNRNYHNIFEHTVPSCAINKIYIVTNIKTLIELSILELTNLELSFENKPSNYDSYIRYVIDKLNNINYLNIKERKLNVQNRI